METKHTPGPWIAAQSDPAEGCDVWWITACPAANQEKEIATVPGGYPHERHEANASLIAAAPELLEALRELLTDMVIAQGNMRKAAKRDPAWEGCAEIIQPRVDAARAAIAKAEGKLCGITSKNADIVQTGDTAGHTGGK